MDTTKATALIKVTRRDTYRGKCSGHHYSAIIVLPGFPRALLGRSCSSSVARRAFEPSAYRSRARENSEDALGVTCDVLLRFRRPHHIREV